MKCLSDVQTKQAMSKKHQKTAKTDKTKNSDVQSLTNKQIFRSKYIKDTKLFQYIVSLLCFSNCFFPSKNKPIVV